MVQHLTDDELRTLPRGGHDYKKLYAAYKAATENLGSGRPTVILAKTVKGWTLGPGFEGRNSTHQIKKMTKQQLLDLRDRLHLHDEIPEELIHAENPPYFRPTEDSIEYQYMMERRKALGGSLPTRTTKARKPLTLPKASAYDEMKAGSGEMEVSTTMGFTRLLRSLCRDDDAGERVVPIIPDEARTFGMDALFRELEIYASQGQKYEPVDHDLLLSYTEDSDGQILEEGITEAGSMASFIAAGTSYATRGVPMIPFYTFYSMFGFQRVGDLVWQAADIRARGFMMAATAGRTTLLGEGLQHQDGHSLVLASTVPSVQAYDPAFAYEVGAIVKAGVEQMYGSDSRENGGDLDPDVVYYITLYNENYVMPKLDPERARRVRDRRRARSVPLARGPGGPVEAGDDPVLRHLPRCRRVRPATNSPNTTTWAPSCGRRRTTRSSARRRSTVERWNRLHPSLEQRVPLVTPVARRFGGPDHRGQRLHEDRARADRPLGTRRAAVQHPRHRRHGPVRHPREAAPILRDRHGSRGRGNPHRAARSRPDRRRSRRRRHQALRHRPGRVRPVPRLSVTVGQGRPAAATIGVRRSASRGPNRVE